MNAPNQRRIVAEVDALKRLQAETAAELDALLPALLDPGPGLQTRIVKLFNALTPEKIKIVEGAATKC